MMQSGSSCSISSKPLVITLLAAAVLAGVIATQSWWKPYLNGSSDSEAPVVEQPPVVQTLEARADAALIALKNLDSTALASLVHPEKGLRFSPYGFIDQDSDLSFSPAQLIELFNNPTTLIWGVQDGSGMPIELNFNDYLKRFVWDLDYTTAPQKSSTEFLGTGNTVNNLEEVYPEGFFVEYHFPGIDPQYDGMDWRSLRLVFEKIGEAWFLVGIVHDGWTI